jgi:hypothetical protein
VVCRAVFTPGIQLNIAAYLSPLSIVYPLIFLPFLKRGKGTGRNPVQINTDERSARGPEPGAPLPSICFVFIRSVNLIG